MNPILQVEPCADLIVSAAMRRSILVGGGSPPVPKKSAAARRWRSKISFKDSRKNFVLSSKFLMTFFNHRKLQPNKYTATATMASAARRQIIRGGAPLNKKT